MTPSGQPTLITAWMTIALYKFKKKASFSSIESSKMLTLWRSWLKFMYLQLDKTAEIMKYLKSVYNVNYEAVDKDG